MTLPQGTEAEDDDEEVADCDAVRDGVNLTKRLASAPVGTGADGAETEGRLMGLIVDVRRVPPPLGRKYRESISRMNLDGSQNSILP